MPLTTEEMERIVVEVTTGGEERIHGEEADAFRDQIKLEVADIKKQGLVVDIPAEWPGPLEE